MGAGQAGLAVIMILLCPTDMSMTVIILYVRQCAFIRGMDELASFLFDLKFLQLQIPTVLSTYSSADVTLSTKLVSYKWTFVYENKNNIVLHHMSV